MSDSISSGSNKDGDEPVAGSFFNVVPPKSETSNIEITDQPNESPFDEVDMFQEIIQKTKLSRGPGQGFAKTTTTSEHVSISNIQTTSTDASGKQQSFVGIGKPLNDIQNPEYDEKGYTLYADETTGEKKRVFEALVEYPSIFKMKIVGQDDEHESFASEIVEVVAESCGVEFAEIEHTKRQSGKWTSVTVHAPVESADMLYALYENVDKNPRVKFKF
jgi:putative lipoic acid-binding regulatory protein